MEMDFTRSFWDELVAARLDLLILDFIDERFDLLQAATPAGPGYKLRVAEFDLSRAELGRLGYWRLPRFTPVVSALWRRSARLFLDRIRSDHPRVRVALHTAPLLDMFEDGKPSVATDWWVRDTEYVAALSKMLEVYERTFLSLDDAVAVLMVDQTHRYLRRGHIWGEAPYHYGDAYYVQLADRIRGLPPGHER
jgi:Family of unknown function (DUF6270)